MATPGQSPIVAAVVTPQPTPGKRAMPWWAWLLLVIVLGGGLLWWFLGRDVHDSTSSGVSNRTEVQVANLGSFVATNGRCVKGYELLAAGRAADGQQHYALLLTLLGDPSDQAGLVTLLGTSPCPDELTSIKQTVAPLIGADTTPNILELSYLTKSGQRLVLP